MTIEKEFAKDLIRFIDNSKSSFHAVVETKKYLTENGFNEVKLEEKWKLEKGGKYFTTKNNSALVAFVVGEKNLTETGFRLVGAHTDSPGFRIKPNPEITADNRYLKLNTEVYGGAILNTWFDRPLSIAGRVSVKGENPLEPKEMLVDLEKPMLIIPNLAIHMNREVNEGFKFNPQLHTLPILSMINDEFEKENYLVKLIAKDLGIDEKDILDFELYLYATEKGSLVGLNEEFISIGKLDDLAMVHAEMNALANAKNKNATNVAIAFDNEEVGSKTKQGAGSPFVKDILKRIALCEGLDEEEFLIALEKSFLISADLAHAKHPNFQEKSDPTNIPVINEGPAIKIAANQAYTTDSTSAAIYEGICAAANVPVQKFVNRSDLKGGSTIGPISSSQLPIRSVDIGGPILGMHSVRELGGVLDHHYVYKSFLEFYNL